jgi:hypothetical protein
VSQRAAGGEPGHAQQRGGHERGPGRRERPQRLGHEAQRAETEAEGGRHPGCRLHRAHGVQRRESGRLDQRRGTAAAGEGAADLPGGERQGQHAQGGAGELRPGAPRQSRAGHEHAQRSRQQGVAGARIEQQPRCGRDPVRVEQAPAEPRPHDPERETRGQPPCPSR